MLTILHQDDDIIAIHKPAGLLVHRSMIDRTETRFAVQLLRDQIGQRVYPAHRLDKGTSGVLLFGLTPEAGRTLMQSFEAQQVAKRYLAVVRGHPEPEGRIDYPLRRQHDDLEGRFVSHDSAPQEAVTDFLRLATIELPVEVDRYPTSRYALLELRPLTGRRHQLRRHMKHIAHPIIGDATHGKGIHNRYFQQAYQCNRMLLACCEMSLPHPRHGTPLRIGTPLEGSFADIISRFGWDEVVPDFS